MLEDLAEKQQFNLRSLILVVTTCAFGVALLANEHMRFPLRLVGGGVCLFWVAIGIFSLSTKFRSPMRECIFLIGLPIFLVCLWCVVGGLLAAIFWWS
ncbi:MAG: hypothetical protein AAFX06_20155 [Planctomycetota bacterium]